MTWLSDPDAWSALAALLALEIVTVSAFEPYIYQRRRRESKSKENVFLHPDRLQTANPARNLSFLGLA